MTTLPPPPPDPAPAVAAVPSWARPGPGESLETLAFRSSAALALLHPLAAGAPPDLPGALLRERLALQAAEACARRLGRAERAAEIRDEVHLLRPGGRPGPAGALFEIWRKTARVRLDRAGVDRLAGLLPPGAQDLLNDMDAARPRWRGRAVSCPPRCGPGPARSPQPWYLPRRR